MIQWLCIWRRRSCRCYYDEENNKHASPAQRGSSSAGRVCTHLLERGATCWCSKSPNSSDQKRKWKFLCTQIYQVVLSNQRKLVLEHFLFISILKIQILNTGISFLFDHVVPQWQALWGATITISIIEICLTIEFSQTLDVNLLIKYSLVFDIFSTAGALVVITV